MNCRATSSTSRAAPLAVVADQVLAAVAVGLLQRGIGRAVAEPAGRPKGLALEFGRAIDPLDREQGGVGLLGPGRRREGRARLRRADRNERASVRDDPG